MRCYIAPEMRELSVSHDPEDWLRYFKYELEQADALHALSGKYPRAQVLSSLAQLGLDTKETCCCEQRDPDYEKWHNGHVEWNTRVWRMLNKHGLLQMLRVSLLRGLRTSEDEWVCGVQRSYVKLLLDHFLSTSPSPEWVNLGA